VDFVNQGAPLPRFCVRLRCAAERPAFVMLNEVKHPGNERNQRSLARQAQILR